MIAGALLTGCGPEQPFVLWWGVENGKTDRTVWRIEETFPSKNECQAALKAKPAPFRSMTDTNVGAQFFGYACWPTGTTPVGRLPGPLADELRANGKLSNC